MSVLDYRDGTLSATASSTADSPLTFTNTYKISEERLVCNVYSFFVSDPDGYLVEFQKTDAAW